MSERAREPWEARADQIAEYADSTSEGQTAYNISELVREHVAAANEYLNDICDAYEAWKKCVDHPPGSGITDEDYPGPSKEECESHDQECSTRWNDLQDAIQTACDARCEP